METNRRPLQPFSQVISQRVSCRSYDQEPLSAENKDKLERYMQSLNGGPFGNRARFVLVSASETERNVLKGLGTYGFIRNASGFIIGVVETQAAHNLEDFGYLMEKVILYATDLGLGTCWLGGSFTKSSFSRKAVVHKGELVPAVAAVGNPARTLHPLEILVRNGADSKRRLSWENLFFNDTFSQTLAKSEAEGFDVGLEMVRLAPSASNKQPWRVLKSGAEFHFYLKRTPGYRESLLVRLFTVADMQRIDMGIAMCHFELGLEETGVFGTWRQQPATAPQALPGMEYVASWVSSVI